MRSCTVTTAPETPYVLLALKTVPVRELPSWAIATGAMGVPPAPANAPPAKAAQMTSRRANRQPIVVIRENMVAAPLLDRDLDEEDDVVDLHERVFAEVGHGHHHEVAALPEGVARHH